MKVPSNLPLLDIPSHWKVARLDRVFRIVNEPARIDDEPVSAFIDGVVTLRSNRPETTIKGSGQELGYKHLEVGDLVISGMNAHIGGLGISDSAGKCTPVYTIMRKNVDINEDFVSYYLWHASQSGYIKSLVNAVRYNSADFGPETVKNFFIPVPPRAEQDSIARKIKENISHIDQLITARLDQMELIKESWVSLFTEKFSDASMKMVPLKYFTWWQEGPGIMAEDFTYDGIPIIRIGNLRSNPPSLDDALCVDFNSGLTKWGHYRVQMDDLLISASATTDAIAIKVTQSLAGAIPYTGIIRIRPTSELLDLDYLRLFLLSPLFFDQVERLKQGIGIQHWGPTHLTQVKIPLPSIESQHRIVSDLQFLKDSEVIELANLQIMKLRELKLALIAEYISGTGCPVGGNNV